MNGDKFMKVSSARYQLAIVVPTKIAGSLLSFRTTSQRLINPHRTRIICIYMEDG
jgi:hypothetical protein